MICQLSKSCTSLNKKTTSLEISNFPTYVLATLLVFRDSAYEAIHIFLPIPIYMRKYKVAYHLVYYKIVLVQSYIYYFN